MLAKILHTKNNSKFANNGSIIMWYRAKSTRNPVIDSHAHLYYDEIYQNLDEKLRIARLAGVSHVLTIGTDFETMPKNIEIAEQRDNIFCSIGVHPLHSYEPRNLDKLRTWSKKEKVVAIGEVGLDYHYEEQNPREIQKALLQDMLSLSDAGLPYIFHARECFPDILDIIAEYNIKNAVFHCYTDSMENAQKILDLGYYISFSGVVTFKKSEELREIAKFVPDDRFLIETDSPYLAPVPYRGKTNEPAFVSLVAECIANLREKTVDEISDITTTNFYNLFTKAKKVIAK